MLDRFVRGEVSRISPEAPVPVVRVRHRDDHLGGAGNVAANIRALGGQVAVAGIVGDDAAGEGIRRRLEALGIDTGAVRAVSSRGTTVKSRVLAHHQQVVRIDEEEDRPLPPEEARGLEEAVRESLAAARILVISDYSKGVVSPELLKGTLAEARRIGLAVAVDPKVPHMELYQPATVVTPNQAEAGRATGREIGSDEEALAAGLHLLEGMDIEALLMTRGEKGMLLCERNREPLLLPTEAREVFDVTGAGDTVIATLSLGIAAEASLPDAARLANRAASVVVGKLGTATCSAVELNEALAREGVHA
jgi:D-beta-D-heptose 7-phosphate kinase/D-beta-D-heptose 1-phosphate adenosyltransferase